MTTDHKDITFTVVVPVLNRIDTIARCIRSIADQDTGLLKIIAVDNGSTDGTRELLDELASECRSRGVEMTVVDEPSRGAAVARNTGLRLADTPWTMFFDSDDYMLPGHVKRWHDLIIAHPEAELVGAPVVEVDTAGRRTVRPFATDLKSQLHYSVLATPRYAARTTLLKAVGGWDETLTGWDDMELGVRLMLAKPKMLSAGKSPLVVIDVATRGTSTTLTGEGFAHGHEKWESALRLIERHLRDRPERADVQAIRAKLSALYAREGKRELAADYFKQSLRGLTTYQRLIMFAIYGAVRLTGHGGDFLAQKLL